MFKDGSMPSLIPGAPTFTPVASRLLDILAREDAVVEQVAALLRLDTEFVAEVVRLANTPVFGFERQVRSMAQVVALLGTRRLRALIATVALRRSGGDHGALYGYWRHSVAAGFLAAELAPVCGLDPDQAYTAAVMHEHDSRGVCRGFLPTPWPGKGADTLAAAAGLACRFSEVLGFPTLLHTSARPGVDELLTALPPAARLSLTADLTRMARLLQAKVELINN